MFFIQRKYKQNVYIQDIFKIYSRGQNYMETMSIYQ